MTVTAELREAFEDVEGKVGDLYRTELIAGAIIVNPPPYGIHEQIFAKLNSRLTRLSAIDVEISGHRGLQTPLGNFIPDLTVSEPDSFGEQPPWGSPLGILMLVEITPSDSGVDREDKRRAYAAAGIPLYLLVDCQNRESALFSTPDVEAQDYTADIRVPFGTPLPLPEPFSFTLADFTPTVDN